MEKIKAKELLTLLKDVKNVKCQTYGTTVFVDSLSRETIIHLNENAEIYFTSDAEYVAVNGENLNFRIGIGDVGIYFGKQSNLFAIHIF